MDNFRGCLKSRNMYNVPCVEREEKGEEGRRTGCTVWMKLLIGDGVVTNLRIQRIQKS